MDLATLAVVAPDPALRASILVIGDEILGGFVTDTNSGWLAQQLRELGVPLDRILTVPDDLHAIGETLGGELDRARPRVIVTSGGIGSTPDDLTFAAVARLLGRDLVIEPEIDRRITGIIDRAAEEGTAVDDAHATSMRKMARVPAGARLLPGVEGVAPGVAVDVDGGIDAGGATVAVLPGIPSEFRRIIVDGVQPTLLAGRGRREHVHEVTHGYPESIMNPVLDRVVSEFPDVHVGSYPGRDCVVRLKGNRERVEEAAELVRAYLADLDATPGAARLRASWQDRWE